MSSGHCIRYLMHAAPPLVMIGAQAASCSFQPTCTGAAAAVWRTAAGASHPGKGRRQRGLGTLSREAHQGWRGRPHRCDHGAALVRSRCPSSLSSGLLNRLSKLRLSSNCCRAWSKPLLALLPWRAGSATPKAWWLAPPVAAMVLFQRAATTSLSWSCCSRSATCCCGLTCSATAKGGVQVGGRV